MGCKSIEKTLNTKNGKIAPTIILIVDKSNNAFMENKDFYEFVKQLNTLNTTI